VNTKEALETVQYVFIDIDTASPELFTRYKHQLVYDKLNDTLCIKKAKGTFRLSNQYNLRLQWQ